MSDIPPVVSKRNEFCSSRLMVEDALRTLPEAYQSERFKEWLLRFTEGVITQVDQAFATGAQRGVEQVSKLLRDPDYYVTLKERRRKEFQRQKEQSEKYDQERREKEQCPTQEQIDKQMGSLEAWLVDDRARVERMEKELERLKSLNPKHIRFPKDPKTVKTIIYGG